MEQGMTMKEQSADFETQYIGIRNKEQRMYTDAQLLQLPDVPENHVHYKEWQIRKASADKLYNYLANRKRPQNILEVGCGNGWLSAYLANMPDANVTGADINNTELQQAGKVFSGQNNLQFLYGDIRDNIALEASFDVLVFAASVQYFSSLKEIINTALGLLKPGGEIHIIDTIFYPATEAKHASERSKSYFTNSGYPAMSGFYFHHSLAELAGYNYKLLYNPAAFINRLLKKTSPFYWVCISNDR